MIKMDKQRIIDIGIIILSLIAGNVCREIYVRNRDKKSQVKESEKES